MTMNPFTLYLEQLAAVGWHVSVSGPLALAGASPDAQPAPSTSREPCARCGETGELSADGRAHSQAAWRSGSIATRACPDCDGTGSVVVQHEPTRYHVTWVADAIAPIDGVYDSEREVCVALEAALRGFCMGKDAGLAAGRQAFSGALNAVFPNTRTYESGDTDAR